MLNQCTLDTPSYCRFEHLLSPRSMYINTGWKSIYFNSWHLWLLFKPYNCHDSASSNYICCWLTPPHPHTPLPEAPGEQSLVGELTNLEMVEPYWKRGPELRNTGTILCRMSKSLADRLMRWGNNHANRGGAERGIPAWHGNQGLESEQDSPQACRAEPEQVSALWFWVSLLTKGSMQWAGLLCLELHESSCNCIFMWLWAALSAFVHWCMCLFVCVCVSARKEEFQMCDFLLFLVK